ncbi:MAG: winged helix-turn-helix transcriptional regulator [Methanobrevibacter sp.]|jgi:DNA-binding MarR family transcriptional regulator|nr:winged helix-turn-helix transcriptional regulator [Methanobrevibacter sp.]
MIKIKLMRTISGKDLVNEFEKKYKTLKNLKKIFLEDNENMELEMYIGDWEYFLDHPDEITEQEKILYSEKPHFTEIDLELLSYIKNYEVKSITDLAKYFNKDVSTIQKSVKKLKERGIIELEEGKPNNRKTPIFSYDKIEIAI